MKQVQNNEHLWENGKRIGRKRGNKILWGTL